MGWMLSSSSATVFVAADRSHRSEPVMLAGSSANGMRLLNSGAVEMSGAVAFAVYWLGLTGGCGNVGMKDIALTDIDCCC